MNDLDRIAARLAGLGQTALAVAPARGFTGGRLSHRPAAGKTGGG